MTSHTISILHKKRHDNIMFTLSTKNNNSTCELDYSQQAIDQQTKIATCIIYTEKLLYVHVHACSVVTRLIRVYRGSSIRLGGYLVWWGGRYLKAFYQLLRLLCAASH